MTEITYGDLVRQCMALESRMSQSLEAYARGKFERGCLLHQTVLGEKQYGAGTMATLADELGCSDSTLYKEYALAEFYGFDSGRFEQDIERLRKNGRQVSYTALLRHVNPEKNPSAVGGIENHKDIVCKDIEHLADRVSQATELYGDDQEVQGAVRLGVETLEGAEEYSEFLVGNILTPKPARGLKVRLPHYLEFIRSMPCAITGTIVGVEAHHVTLRSRGQNSLDIFAIPLSKEKHEEFHKLGLKGFEEKYKASCRTMILGYIQLYVKEHR